MKKKTRKEKRQEQKVSNKENEKRLNIINSSYKCTVCGAWIKYQSRKKHLRIKHNLFPEDIKSFFLNKKAVREQKKEEIIAKVLKAEFEKNSRRKDTGFYKCGEKVSGSPFVRIIYNAVGTNRRKH